MHGTSARSIVLVLLVASAALVWQPCSLPLELLPADSWLYAAMADEPTVFTARPWGYRLLGPWLVHWLFESHRGFAYLAPTALVLASLLLFLFLRRLGHGQSVSLAAAAVFALSGPVAVGLENPYLCEPLTVLLEITFLLAVESGAGLGVLALLAVLAVLSKEILLVLLPVVFLARWPHEGIPRALRAAALVALPALTVTALMRVWWAPHLLTPYHLPDADVLPLALDRLQRSWAETGFWLGGVTPLALLGALTPAARPFLRRYGYLVVLFLALPFVAWIYDPRPGRLPFFGITVRRLLIYALPVLLPLALFAVTRILPRFVAPLRTRRRPRWLLNGLAAAGTLILAAFPFWGLDRYRRAQILGPLHGPVVRALCRESLRTATRLAQGEEILLDPEWSVTSRKNPKLIRIKWYLRDGWGPFPFYGSEDVVMRGRTASLHLPCLDPEDLELRLALSSPGETVVGVEVNGFLVGRLAVGPAPEAQLLRLPASALFRGDNVLGLVAVEDDHQEIRFGEARIRLVPHGS